MSPRDFPRVAFGVKARDNVLAHNIVKVFLDYDTRCRASLTRYSLLRERERCISWKLALCFTYPHPTIMFTLGSTDYELLSPKFNQAFDEVHQLMYAVSVIQSVGGPFDVVSVTSA